MALGPVQSMCRVWPSHQEVEAVVQTLKPELPRTRVALLVLGDVRGGECGLSVRSEAPRTQTEPRGIAWEAPEQL